jgi:hypothetical protein
MQKVIVNGVPFWKDKSNTIYSYELDKKNLITLGTIVNDSYKLKEGWEEIYREVVYTYRANLKDRERKENKGIAK